MRFPGKKAKIPRKRLRIILTVLLPFLLPPPLLTLTTPSPVLLVYTFFPFLSITSQLRPRVTTVMYVRGTPPCFLDSFIGWSSCTRKEEGIPPSLADIVVVMCVEGNLDERMCNVGQLHESKDAGEALPLLLAMIFENGVCDTVTAAMALKMWIYLYILSWLLKTRKFTDDPQTPEVPNFCNDQPRD